MSEVVATKEFEAGLSLLHMMQVPSDASSAGDSPAGSAPSTAAKKKRQGGAGGATTPRPAKKARVKAVGSLLLAAAHQVDPKHADYDEDEDDEDCEEGSEWGGDSTSGPGRGDSRRNAQLNTLTRELHIDELREHFNKPIVDVAKEFGICTTFLKKICRRCGIKRWPHRQIRSLTRTIEMLRQAEANATSVQEKAKYASQIALVEAKMRAVIEDPDANGKLERVKKSVLNRSGSPSSRKSSGDATPRSKSTASPSVVQATLLHAVAVAAAAADDETNSKPAEAMSPKPLSNMAVLTATEAEAAAAEALLFSASPRTLVTSIDVDVPIVDIGSDALPAMTPTASSTPELTPQQSLKISPSHRKVFAGTKGDGEHRMRSSSLGSLQDLDAAGPCSEDGEEPTTPVSVLPSTAAAVEAS